MYKQEKYNQNGLELGNSLFNPSMVYIYYAVFSQKLFDQRHNNGYLQKMTIIKQIFRVFS